jgi:hypothetical protein
MGSAIGLHEKFGVFFREVFIGFPEQFDFIAQDLLAIAGDINRFLGDILGHTNEDYTTLPQLFDRRLGLIV